MCIRDSLILLLNKLQALNTADQADEAKQETSQHITGIMYIKINPTKPYYKNQQIQTRCQAPGILTSALTQQQQGQESVKCHRDHGMPTGKTISSSRCQGQSCRPAAFKPHVLCVDTLSLIHISEPTRLGMISYAVFCLKKKNIYVTIQT
eukprot:TRINITY_DN12003_c0_g1_i1.p2 TRINITY_DN12003_c0_g1~~TRINITY_DN12003_c0_g1_i1.p2  ORF type:complete len:150 (+),score=9.47 TRINITY_DN12003_c0_g1_i1:133-582(+)